ncbi:13432_t:CDS:2, partial [Racocetra fulgida]
FWTEKAKQSHRNTSDSNKEVYKDTDENSNDTEYIEDNGESSNNEESINEFFANYEAFSQYENAGFQEKDEPETMLRNKQWLLSNGTDVEIIAEIDGISSEKIEAKYETTLSPKDKNMLTKLKRAT